MTNRLTRRFVYEDPHGDLRVMSFFHDDCTGLTTRHISAPLDGTPTSVYEGGKGNPAPHLSKETHHGQGPC